MILLIHLLEHLGVPSGAAIAMVIAGKKLLTGGAAKIDARRHRDDRHHGGRPLRYYR
ncbi:MAG: hypothetical protein ACRDOB_12195 [Streptosporangiaceae bacterium]